jgi:hypothetical protein
MMIYQLEGGDELPHLVHGPIAAHRSWAGRGGRRRGGSRPCAWGAIGDPVEGQWRGPSSGAGAVELLHNCCEALCGHAHNSDTESAAFVHVASAGADHCCRCTCGESR